MSTESKQRELDFPEWYFIPPTEKTDKLPLPHNKDFSCELNIHVFQTHIPFPQDWVNNDKFFLSTNAYHIVISENKTTTQVN